MNGVNPLSHKLVQLILNLFETFVIVQKKDVGIRTYMNAVDYYLILFLISFSLTCNVTRAFGGEMKLFKFVQNTCQSIGILSFELNPNRSPINWKHDFFHFCEVQFFVSSAAFLLFEANSMIDYGMASFNCLTILLCIILYLILFWQMNNILNFIDNCERFIGKRK